MDANEEDLPASSYSLGLSRTFIDPRGTNFGGVYLPNGTYERVELVMVFDCDNVRPRGAVEFSNDNGLTPFRLTDENITLKFIGRVVVNEGTTVNLDASEYFQAMEGITSRAQIRPAFDAINGSF
ncbi:MAG: hypothetical protein ACLGG7_03855 [Bacteriovoracia bacterium]